VSLRWVLASLVAFNAAMIGFVACGARTGLPIDDETSDAGPDTPVDGGPDATDAPKDSPVDIGPDVPEDVVSDCTDPSTKFIYLVTQEKDLYSFNPANGAFVLRGTLNCPSDATATPFSMGVDRKGTAFVVYNDGNLFQVSTKDASCKPTPFVPNQQQFRTFGMGYALDGPTSTNETLYVAEISFTNPSLGLASIDTKTFALSFIGPFSSNPANEIEMTSAPDGNLYGCFLDSTGGNGWVVQIDKTNGTILSEKQIPIAAGPSSALAFAAWGGKFYVFTTPSGTMSTNVTRFDPTDGSLTVVANLNRVVVGAGVSTCAPM